MAIYDIYQMIKQAAFDLPDLEVNPRNKMTRLMKGLKWGVKVNGKSESPDETTFIFNLDPKTKYEVIGDDSSDIASCVDLTNRVVKNMKGIGSLATLTSNGGVPHLTPLFKHKGKYYLIHGEHQYSNPYDTLDAVGDRWYTDPSVPVPEYVDFYDLPADETITEKDLRKVIDEVKRKAKKTYRKYYTDRPGYKEKQASRLYTYVDPDADLSQGLLSLRNAPEWAIINKYRGRVKDLDNLNKEYVIKRREELDPTGPDWIYAFDAPIPDKANDGLIRFRNTHKLVSWDPEQVKDVIKILRRYHNPKTREEVSVNFTPLKYMRWIRGKDNMSFRHAPVYKVLTESGRIPPELLTYE